MVELLKEYHGFEEVSINILIDTDDSYDKPTGATIKACTSLWAMYLWAMYLFSTAVVCSTVVVSLTDVTVLNLQVDSLRCLLWRGM